jgi:type VI secretion system secreted protein VgrG
MDSQAKYKLELPNGQHYNIDPSAQSEQHKTSAGMGYHGYSNPGGSLTDDHQQLEQDRLQANPATRKEQ